MKKYRKVKYHKILKLKKQKSKYELILYPKVLKLFFYIILLCICFMKRKKGKETSIKNIHNNSNNTIIKNITFNNDKHNIHLSINIDNNYIYPCIVYMTSLLHNRMQSSFYNIHLLTNNNLTKEAMIKINKIAEKFGNNSVKLNYYNLENYFKNATTGHLSVATYFKLALPSLLPNLDKIIYADLDTINLNDLTEMYNIEFKEKMYFGGTLDYIDHLSQLREFGLSSDKYINGGVLLMNLKAMREDSIDKKLSDFIATHTLKLLEQTAINCICYNNIQILPYKYNVFAYPTFEIFAKINNQQNNKYKFNNSELLKDYNEPTFFHYISLPKPWLRSTTKFNRVYWWYYAKMSGFYQEILDYYKFDKREIDTLLSQIPEDGGLLKRNYKKLD